MRTHMAAALVLSLSLHLGGYLWWDAREQTPGSEQAAVTVAALSVKLIQPAPPAPPTTSAPQATPVVAEPPRQRLPKPRPAAAEQSPAPVVSTAEPLADPGAVAEVSPAPVTASGPSAGVLRDRYLQQLYAHIERHKFYPSAARRRGMEASVRVSFTLNRTGGVDALEIRGGPKLLRDAAAVALRRAEPLPRPPDSVDSPLRVDYLMVFALH